MNGLKYLVWTCTRAYETRYAYSLGDGRPLPDELTTDEAKALIDKAADFGVEHFFITPGGGGEPCLRKDILEIIRYASERGVGPYLKTSGWRIDGSVSEHLASCGCKVIISIAGLEAVDDALRGKGAHKRSLDAAKLCAKKGILFSLSVVNTRHIVNQIRGLVELAMELGSRGFSLACLIPQPICVEEQLSILGPLEPTAEEHEKELNEIYDLSKKMGEEIRLMAYDIFYNRIRKQREPSLKLRSRCSLCHNLEGNEWLELLDDGKAYGCSPSGIVFGDVRKDSLGEILDRIRASSIVRRLADPSNIKGKCGVCEFKDSCGGCRARAYIYSKDIFAQDPLCSYKPRSMR
jgi:radical SAM protein with 4Fe4S-binding SPASM domain